METKQESLVQGIDTVIVRVSDVASAKKWFTGVLGLSAVWEDPDLKLVVLDTNSSTSLTLWQSDERVQVNKSVASFPIFRTNDAEKLRNELLRNGVKTDELVQDAHVKYFQFFDPDGNVFEACEVGSEDE